MCVSERSVCPSSVTCCRWVIFNDEKVAESKSPPLTMAYLYIYKRRA